MASLAERLDSIQDQILNLYEEGSKNLEDHIKYWQLVGQEQTTLYYAREKGLNRVGITNVPALQVSRKRAKEAIEMAMVLTTLKDSQYGREQWTFTQTSREMYTAEPEFTLKKQGFQVQIEFDNNPENSVEETGWMFIYAQDLENKWHKYMGEVDNKGLFYTDSDGLKRYYVDFRELADRYGRTGGYKATIGDQVIADVASTSVVATDAPVREQPPAAPETTPPRRVPTRPPPARTPSRTPTRSGRKRPRRRPTRTPAKRARPTSAATPSTSTSTSQAETQARPISSTSHPASKAQGRSRQARSTAPAAPTSGEVGSRHTSVSARGLSRLQRLLQEARDPPALVLKGPANSLKCLRFRVKKNHPGTFEHLSTTWWWTGGRGKERVGPASMLVLFRSARQREQFLMSVPVPASIKVNPVAFYE